MADCLTDLTGGVSHKMRIDSGEGEAAAKSGEGGRGAHTVHARSGRHSCLEPRMRACPRHEARAPRNCDRTRTEARAPRTVRRQATCGRA